MSEPPADPALLLDGDFPDVDALSEAIHGWGLDFTQLEAGPFRSRLRQWMEGPVLVSYARIRGKLAQRGASPAGALTFGLHASAGGRTTWRGQETSANDLMVFPENGELEAVSDDSFEVFTLSIPEEVWEEVEAASGGLVGELLDRRGRVVRCSSRSIGMLRRAMRCSEFRPSGGGAGGGGDLASLALEAVRDGGDLSGGAHRGDRREVVRASVAYIDAMGARAVRMTNLCRAAGASERTLQYAFKAEFGLTPVEFVRVRRLHRARRQLVRARPRVGAVADIARACGFPHGGQFAADYRVLFGELPSETLQR